MHNTLLLIVDVQYQFLPEGRIGKEFCTAIEELQKKYHYIAASQFVNTPDSFWVKYLEWDKMMAGDSGAELAFTPSEGTFIYKNHKFTSYTSELQDYINKNHISEVHVCGVDTDACIIATAYNLWDEKIHFKVLIDHCISSAGENTHAVAHKIMNKNFSFKIVVTEESIRK